MVEMSNKLVSIVIVFGGISDYLQPLLDSLRSQTLPASEIIVVDNSLNPDFKQKITAFFPDVKLYLSKQNLFYCQALNIGIKLSRADFILCLNDDVVLDKNFIQEALRGFSINTRVGIVSGKILRQDAKIIDSTGLFLSPWRTAHERGYGRKDRGQFDKEGYIFGVNGAVAFYRREMLEEIKEGDDYFDPRFRIFYEDLDVAWRAHNNGWRGYYIPQAIAYHARGGTVRRSYGIGMPYARKYLSDELHSDLIKNRYLTIIKNEGLLGFLGRLLFMLPYEIITWSYVLLFKPKIIKIFLSQVNYLRYTLRKRYAKQELLKKDVG